MMMSSDKIFIFLFVASQVICIFGAVNVAINKPTRQSTINLGVNTSSWAGLTAWWCIDLLQEFHINTVRILERAHGGRHELSDGFEMRISSSGQCDKAGFTAATPCFKDSASTTDSVYTIERCNHPAIPSLSARYIFISVKRTDARLDICEVQVFADDCPDGFYGSNCNIRCPTSCLNNTCDKIGGSCSNGCHGDHYGKRCQSICSGHCKDGKCDDRIGRCFGCKDGYYGDVCEESCFTCNGTCRQVDGVCLIGCRDGYWGSNGLCLQTCSSCTSGGCRIADGDCNNARKVSLTKNSFITPTINTTDDGDIVYTIAVKTGNRANAGTNARVHVQIIGTTSQTGLIRIDDLKRNDFEQGSTDVFERKANDVGEIKQVLLKRDNNGVNPSWYVENIVITKAATLTAMKEGLTVEGNAIKIPLKTDHIFVFERWLDLERRVDKTSTIVHYLTIQSIAERK
ncbi:uncharacterized protein LOC126821030 isoform X1 [Patella vulgata]|uniref:uncharacterized protein LOC126821030 isoform X1 n=2 Tax=Patella vulgata TaxID=6465 RepID=UPI0024A99F94|nr:uncharacterized protein LOC126821030 isoform X1 [Patella vulgata]